MLIHIAIYFPPPPPLDRPLNTMLCTLDDDGDAVKGFCKAMDNAVYKYPVPNY